MDKPTTHVLEFFLSLRQSNAMLRILSDRIVWVTHSLQVYSDLASYIVHFVVHFVVHYVVHFILWCKHTKMHMQSR